MKEERFPQLSKCGEIRPDWTEQKLQNLGGEHSNWFVEGKTESTLHRSALPSCNPQPETLFCPCWPRINMGALRTELSGRAWLPGVGSPLLTPSASRAF